MKNELSFAILFSIFSQAIILLGALFYGRKNLLWRANIFLGLFVVAGTYLGFLNYLVTAGMFFRYEWLAATWNAVGIGLGPLLFLYVTYLLDETRTFRLRDFSHFILPLALLIASIIYYQTYAKQVEEDPRLLMAKLYPFFILQHLTGLAYILGITFRIRKFEFFLIHNFSNFSQHRVDWLRFVVRLLVAAWLFSVWETTIYVQDVAAFSKLVVVLLFLSSVSFYALFKEVAFGRGAIERKSCVNSQSLYANSNLSQEEIRAHGKMIMKALVDQKLFLNPDLKLLDLAEVVGLSPVMVSQVLNQGLRKSFYDLVNDLRVQHACTMLATGSPIKVLTVAFESGFNTKSTFNAAFKKVTGETPKEYRASHVTA